MTDSHNFETTSFPFYLGGTIRHIPISDKANEISLMTMTNDQTFRRFKRNPKRWSSWQLVEERSMTELEIDDVFWRLLLLEPWPATARVA